MGGYSAHLSSREIAVKRRKMEMQVTKGMLMFLLGSIGIVGTLVAIIVYILLARRDMRKLIERLDAIYKGKSK